MDNNETPEICSRCGGKCCLRMPGAVWPDQLPEITVKTLSEYYHAGYQFDYWEGNPGNDPKYDGVKAYYLRPQTVRARGEIVNGSWGAPCAFLTSKGCSLKFEDRPRECQGLIANEELHCKPSLGSKRDAAIAWLPYNDIIEATIAEFEKI